ncbi:MAG: hypothetical protein ACR2MS_05470, partial [Weeksellaceae bacterium]
MLKILYLMFFSFSLVLYAQKKENTYIALKYDANHDSIGYSPYYANSIVPDTFYILNSKYEEESSIYDRMIKEYRLSPVPPLEFKLPSKPTRYYFFSVKKRVEDYYKLIFQSRDLSKGYSVNYIYY